MERALEYIGPDELVEITPESIRLRKLAKNRAEALRPQPSPWGGPGPPPKGT
jgi:predicted membrane GTPase involved in stress response